MEDSHLDAIVAAILATRLIDLPGVGEEYLPAEERSGPDPSEAIRVYRATLNHLRGTGGALAKHPD